MGRYHCLDHFRRMVRVEEIQILCVMKNKPYVDGSVTVRMLRGKWTADTVKDGQILRSIINKSSFYESEYDQVLIEVGKFGLDLATIYPKTRPARNW